MCVFIPVRMRFVYVCVCVYRSQLPHLFSALILDLLSPSISSSCVLNAFIS